MKRVYVAGKLNDDAVGYIQNMHVMCKTSDMVRKAGFAVFIPGLDFLCGMQAGDWTYRDYFDNSQPWLMASDAVFLCPNWRSSKGTRREMETAKRHGIPIFEDLKELIKWRDK